MFPVQQSPLGFFGMELPGLCFILAFTCSLTHSFIQSFIKHQRLLHGLDRVVGDTMCEGMNDSDGGKTRGPSFL